MNLLKRSTLALTMTAMFSNGALATSVENYGEFFTSIRVGYITNEDENDDTGEGASVGLKAGYISPQWHGLKAAATAYSTTKLLNDDNNDFFGSDGDGYIILGEAYLQADLANTQIKAGRFEFDSPHADTDDIRMVPNTFSGLVITNTDIKDTTLYLAHLDQWAGVDSDKPEEFTDLNGDDGLTAVAALYQGFDNIALQSWYYYGNNLADLFYAEAIYEVEQFSVGIQLGDQSDNTDDNSGPDGTVYGINASYNLNNFTLSTAYNNVSGIVVNGFGGGPFFTSSDDHTIEGVEDQSALAFGVEYSGIDKLTLGTFHVDFDQGENESDYYAAYEFNEEMSLEAIYTDMYDDGYIARVMFNLSF